MHLAAKLRLSLLSSANSSFNHLDASQSPRALNFVQVEKIFNIFLSHFLSFFSSLFFIFFPFFFDNWKVGSSFSSLPPPQNSINSITFAVSKLGVVQVNQVRR